MKFRALILLTFCLCASGQRLNEPQTTNPTIQGCYWYFDFGRCQTTESAHLEKLRSAYKLLQELIVKSEHLGPGQINYQKPYSGPLPRSLAVSGFDTDMLVVGDQDPIYGFVRKVEPAGSVKTFVPKNLPLPETFKPVSCDALLSPEMAKTTQCGESDRMSLVLCPGPQPDFKNCQRVFISGTYWRETLNPKASFVFYLPGSDYYTPRDNDIFDPLPLRVADDK